MRIDWPSDRWLPSIRAPQLAALPRRLTRGLKQLRDMVFPRSHWSWALPRSRRDYEREIGDGFSSSVLMAPVRWIARTFPEAPMILTNPDEEIVRQHPMLTLLRRPNEFYSGRVLWMATMASVVLDGNGYWLVRRGANLQPVELWYAPHWMVDPQFPDDGTVFISHYLYRPLGREPVRIEVEDVIHFRDGLDPHNTRKGFSALKSILREVYTDEEAATFTAGLLSNMGVPGIVVSPDEDAAIVTDEDMELTRQWWQQRFSGDRRGEALVMRGRTRIEQFGFSPQQLDLRALRRVPEERVTAVLGTPAIVVGLGAGLDRSTFANFAEAREAAYESCIIPLQNLVAEEVWAQLLDEFEPSIEGWTVGFDLSVVRVLQEDENARSTRILAQLGGALITQAEARSELGYEIDAEHERYYFPFTTLVVPAGEQPMARLPEPVEPEAAALARPAGKLLLPAGSDQKAVPELMRQMLRDWLELSDSWQRELVTLFRSWGSTLAAAYESLDAGGAFRAARAGETKDVDDEAAANLVWMTASTQLDPLDFRPHYLRVLRRTVRSVNSMLGLGVFLRDHNELRVVSEGGKRMGLVDMSAQSRQAMFRALSQARAEGMGPPATARRIRELVEAGPWRSPQVRAVVIARTETKYAQNVSALEVYRESNTVRMVQVVDAQLGPTDADCEFQNGRIVSFAEAQALAVDEHPNGTRSFTPIVEPEARSSSVERVDVAELRAELAELRAELATTVGDALRRMAKISELPKARFEDAGPVRRELRILRDEYGDVSGAEVFEHRRSARIERDTNGKMVEAETSED